MRTSKLERNSALIRLECEDGNSDLCDNMQCVCGKEILRDFLAKKIALHFDIYEDYYFISICPPNSIYAIGDLQDFDLKQSIEYKVCSACGRFDIAKNEQLALWTR